MDAAARDHQPHFGRATDASLERRRIEARDAMIERATKATEAHGPRRVTSW
jgi:hypothetical protein